MSSGGGTMIGAWILIATFIQGIGCVYFTQSDKNLSIRYTTPTKTAITRFISILQHDETKQHISVEKITKQGGDALLLGPYFTVDQNGWVYVNQRLDMNLVGTVFTVTLSARPLDKPSSAPTRALLHVEISQQYDCDVDKMCYQTPGSRELLFYFRETEREGDMVVAMLKEPNIVPECGSVELQYSLRETGQSTRWPGIVSISNSTSALIVKRPLDREKINSITADVTCHVIMKYSRPTVKRKMSIQVLDVDDEEPYIPWRDMVLKRNMKAKNKTYDFISDEVCGEELVIADKDVGPDNYTVRIEDDPLQAFSMGPVTMMQGPPQFISAAIRCKDKLKNIGIYEVNVIFTDTSLISKHKNNEARFTLRVNTGDKPSDLCVTTQQQNLDTPIIDYKLINTDKVIINTTAGHYYRVFDVGKALKIKENSDWDFYLDNQDSFFNITPRRGYIYVDRPDVLSRSEGTTEILHVRFNDRHCRRHGSVRIKVKVIQSPGTSGNARCARYQDLDQCEQTSGLATSDGRCQARRQGDNRQKFRYRTCSYDLDKCPDGVCDELEELANICPQDCIDKRKVTGAQPSPNERGIYKADHCWCPYEERFEKWRACICSIVPRNWHPKIPPIVVRPTTTKTTEDVYSIVTSNQSLRDQKVIQDTSNIICDSRCQTVLSVTVTFLGLLLFIFPAIYSSGVYKFCLKPRPVNDDVKHMNGLMSLSGMLDTDGLTGMVNDENWIQNYVQRNVLLDHKWEIKRDRLILDENGNVGEGEFGQVVKATLRNETSQETTVVAVKMLKNCASETELKDLVSEYSLLKEVSHPNVIKLMGACTEDGPLYLVVEYCENGSLRDYLRTSRQLTYLQPISDEMDNDVITPDQSVERLKVEELMSYAWQIVKGMEYLSNMKLVHRDLASRNILITQNLEAKISDFGLTRDIYEADNYKKKSKGRIPVKWMAPESLYDQIYTTKSDVWSFGVLLWEIVTLGATPYPGIAPERLCTLLKAGYRMERPDNCSVELYSIMSRCWMTSWFDRPTFTELVHKFDELLTSGASYLEIDTCVCTIPITDDDVKSHDVIYNVSTADEKDKEGDSGMGSSGSQSDDRGDPECPSSYEKQGSLDAISIDSNCFLPTDTPRDLNERSQLLMTSQRKDTVSSVDEDQVGELLRRELSV